MNWRLRRLEKPRANPPEAEELCYSRASSAWRPLGFLEGKENKVFHSPAAITFAQGIHPRLSHPLNWKSPTLEPPPGAAFPRRMRASVARKRSESARADRQGIRRHPVSCLPVHPAGFFCRPRPVQQSYLPGKRKPDHTGFEGKHDSCGLRESASCRAAPSGPCRGRPGADPAWCHPWQSRGPPAASMRPQEIATAPVHIPGPATRQRHPR